MNSETMEEKRMKQERSKEALNAADEFMTALKNGTLSKHVLPNNYEDYTIEIENIDYINYQNYLRTLSYYNYVENRTVAYNGQL